MEKLDQVLFDLTEKLDLDMHREIGKPIRIKVQNKFYFQLEVSDNDEVLLIFSIGEIPPGRYRENIFKEALKENYRSRGFDGVLSYAERPNLLMLYHKIHIDILSAEEILIWLEKMIPKGELWFDALHGGRSSPQIEQSLSKPRPFGV